MIEVFAVVGVAIILCFGAVLLFGAPYLPTLRPQIQTAFELLDLQPSDTLLEIGSGDGRVLVEAAKRGFNAVGYELNPLLVVVSLWHTRKYRKNVKVIWGNAWKHEWPPVQAIYIFGLDRIMPKLHTKIVQSGLRDVHVASFTFKIPGKRPLRTKKGVYLYRY